MTTGYTSAACLTRVRRVRWCAPLAAGATTWAWDLAATVAAIQWDPEEEAYWGSTEMRKDGYVVGY
ncbi:MAG: hypothetical protein ABEL04_05245 [Salinibacter sp.]|uniref:hypothetical protein n=1 Tax=Salinibacter sp. TaxID=2065818 RepID=UPI0035D3E3B2